jgi:hypothetical protein
MEDLLTSLSKVEKASPSYILMGLMLSSATDILEYRYEPENKEVGLIPIDRMISIIEANRDLTNFAYRDIEEYEKSYYSSRWVGQHITDAVRLGPAAPGSYVIRFVYPGIGSQIQTNLKEAARLSDEKMRLVCNKMESSVRTVIECAESGADMIEPEKKISYNFVAAMMKLEFEDADIEFKRIATIGYKGKEPVSIPMTNKIFKRVSVIERGMRPPEMSLDMNLVGYLVQVKDHRMEKENIPGVFKLKFMLDGDKIQTAKLKLSGDDLMAAYDAMKERKAVSLKGKIIGARNSKEIEDVYDFQII